MSDPSHTVSAVDQDAMREKVARLIEPEAFSIGRMAYPGDQWRASAYRKADAILALFAPNPPQEGGEL